jgi:multiple antibiotic resistance protein
MDWAYLFKIGIALFAIVNPIGSVPIFISATDGWEQKQKMRTANVVALTVFLVLAASALFG